ncbi:LOW QUALITY PROTEIN: elongation of very long chain fatty acids protein 4-like [Vespula squamosa]|uniref:Elongation of very long chain fatty acids protein n=1 Tax=Vespula squamosa TaxID=30214 RepID=A0ABD2C7D0_VESSQ
MNSLSNIYKNFIENVDPRLKSWPLIESVSIVPMFIGIYIILLFVSMKYMKNRTAYSLKIFIYFYNIFQVIANSIIVYMYIDGGWYKDIFIYCVPVTYSTDPASMKIASTMWWTLILKLIDLIETGIFVLRKKNRQISFLHVYHHITTILLMWLGVRYYAGGMASFLPVVNCSIHVIMYTYYFLSSLGPKMQKFILPYKPILTITQMVQFVVLMSHLFQAFLPSCNVPKLPVIITFLDIVINFQLFYNFYQKNYKNSKMKNPRVKDWILFNSPYPIILIIFSYFYFVLACGPRFMKNRKPYSLKTFMRYYNIFQIVMNSFIVYKFAVGSPELRYIANQLSTVQIPLVWRYHLIFVSTLLEASWWAMLTKFVDLLETGIFVLRKKDRQISFLHLYHHVSTVLLGWIFGKYYADGMGTFIPLVNCNVHVIMYTYYLLSTYGPSVRKIIHPYKFLLTVTQMVQFVILICYILQTFLPNCDMDKIPSLMMIINLFKPVIPD